MAINEPIIEKDFTPLQKFFAKNGWDYSTSKELEENIDVKQKGGMFLYNYNDRVLVPRNHPVLMMCRGLVLRSDGTPLNVPFKRFFNWFEEEQAEIDWKNAKFVEKLDGSLICVFWNGTYWEVTTRGSFYPNFEGTEFDIIFRRLFNCEQRLLKNHCYMFEMVSTENRIITKYDREFVSLIGIRNLETLDEEDPTTSDLFKNRIFDLKNLNDARDALRTTPKDFEGFVVVDKNFNRLKIKSEEYLRMARIRSLKERDMFDVIVKGASLDMEMVEAFPEVKEKLALMKTGWETYCAEARAQFEAIQRTAPLTRKEFAAIAIKHPLISGTLFALLDHRKIEDHIHWNSFERWIERRAQDKTCEGENGCN